MPEVSVIIPAFNQERWIAETLDSVLAQSFTDWECVVMDDGSSDGTLAVAEDYARRDERIRVFSQPDRGVSSARNNAIRHSSGTFLLPLDADDTISPSYIETAMKRFAEVPETKLVYCRADFFGDMSGEWDLRPYKWDDFIRINCIFNACLFRRSDYDRTPGYDESMKNGLEDWEFLLSLLGPEDVVYQIPDVLFHYRRRADSKTSVAATREPELFHYIVSRHSEIYKDIIFNELRASVINPDLGLERKVGHVILKPRRLFKALFKKGR